MREISAAVHPKAASRSLVSMKGKIAGLREIFLPWGRITSMALESWGEVILL